MRVSLVSVPIISGLLFQQPKNLAPAPFLKSFSPHYIGSSFSTLDHLIRRHRFYRFSPHYIGSSFSTLSAACRYIQSWRFSPHYIGSSFSTQPEKLGHRSGSHVSVPIISGLLFQLQALLLIINDLQT